MARMRQGAPSPVLTRLRAQSSFSPTMSGGCPTATTWPEAIKNRWGTADTNRRAITAHCPLPRALSERRSSAVREREPTEMGNDAKHLRPR